MKFTLSWLKDYLDTQCDVTAIADKLVNIGLEVESISHDRSGFIISKITEVKPHPNADKLHVCMVDNGQDILQIVCGADNLKAGMKVVLATVGTTIPTNKLAIKQSKIRGIQSKGMLCSERELGLGDNHDGIIELGNEKQIGESFFAVDPVFDLSVTPNRGDCLGVRGIARELAAAGMGKLKPLAIPEIKFHNSESPISVVINDKENCSCFVGCYIEGVKNKESPQWMQDRLKAIGMEPISALVDITNYLAISLNRPMHLYDADKLAGQQLLVRKASSEQFIGLNHQEYKLAEDVTVIADSDKLQAIAGIIGGQESGCTMETSNVFLEVAIFDAVAVGQNSRKLGTVTEASYRFERGLDDEFVIDGAKLALEMIVNLCEGQPYQLSIAKEKKTSPQIKTPFKIETFKKISGTDINEGVAINILQNLGFIYQEGYFLVPSWRHDIDGEADLVEEVLRIYGYDNIPANDLPPFKEQKFSASSPTHVLMMRGMHEVITWSFMDAKKVLGDDGQLVKIKNPITENLNVMRPSVIPNLLEVMAKNLARSEKSIAIFELGPIYFPDKTSKNVLSGLRTGIATKKDIYEAGREYDVFDVKADVLQVLSWYNIDNPQLNCQNTPDYYHPGRSGCFALGKTVLAYFGELAVESKQRVMAFEIFVENIPRVKRKNKIATFSVYPSVYRDFGFVMPEWVSVEELCKVVRVCDKEIIKKIELFDIYRGEDIGANKKSLAISVEMQASDRTLSTDEIDKIHAMIIDNVHSKLGGILRRDYLLD